MSKMLAGAQAARGAVRQWGGARFSRPPPPCRWTAESVFFTLVFAITRPNVAAAAFCAVLAIICDCVCCSEARPASRSSATSFSRQPSLSQTSFSQRARFSRRAHFIWLQTGVSAVSRVAGCPRVKGHRVGLRLNILVVLTAVTIIS